MTYWTLEYNEVEKSLAAWGLSVDVVLERYNQAPDILTATALTDADVALAFPYGASVIVRRDRVSEDGSDDSFSSGSIYFRGKATVPTRSGGGDAERVSYRFAGPWWDFERLVFQQSWNVFAGYVDPDDPESGNTFATQSTSELFLGTKVDGTHQTTGAQVTECVAWAITCGVSVQLGTIDPAVNIVSYNVRDITVAEAIIQMLRWSPDVICWFDYSVSPPRLHARSLANLDTATVTVGTEQFRKLQLKPRYDLQLPAVCLRFKSVNELDGFSWVTISDQKYPVDATGQELGASVHTIELAGSRRTTVAASLETAVINALAGGSTAKAWWQQKAPTLASDKINPSSLFITAGDVTDENGDAVSLAEFPRELVNGQIASWMEVNAVRITIKAKVSYDLYATAAAATAGTTALIAQKVRDKEISVQLMATNAVTGDYSTTSSSVAAEAEPAGLAQAIYDAHSTLQYEGTVELVGSEIPSGLTMGKKLTVAGTDLALENLLIQSITEEPHYGRISLQVGPASHLGVSDLIELLRVNRYRQIYNLPTQRSSGQFGGIADVALGKETSKANTVSGLGLTEIATQIASAPDSKFYAIQQDSKGDTVPGATSGFPIVAIYRKASDGSMDTDFPRVIMDHAALVETEGQPKLVAKWQEFLDADGNKQYVLATAPVSGATGICPPG